MHPNGYYPSLLKHVLLLPDRIRRTSRANIKAHSNSLAMACVKADWVFRGSESSSFSPTMTIHGGAYHYLGAKVAPSNLSSCFLSVYIHDTDYIQQGYKQAAKTPNLSPQLLQNLTQMLIVKSKLSSKILWLFKIGQYQLMHPTIIVW